MFLNCVFSQIKCLFAVRFEHRTCKIEWHLIIKHAKIKEIPAFLTLLPFQCRTDNAVIM
jgi:hypothetical protein